MRYLFQNVFHCLLELYSSVLWGGFNNGWTWCPPEVFSSSSHFSNFCASSLVHPLACDPEMDPSVLCSRRSQFLKCISRRARRSYDGGYPGIFFAEVFRRPWHKRGMRHGWNIQNIAGAGPYKCVSFVFMACITWLRRSNAQLNCSSPFV